MAVRANPTRPQGLQGRSPELALSLREQPQPVPIMAMDCVCKRQSTTHEQGQDPLTVAFDDLMSLMLLQFPLIIVFSHGLHRSRSQDIHR